MTMKHTFNCSINPTLAGEFHDSLVFVWDEVAGAVSGPGAATIRALIERGWVDVGPHPRSGWAIDSASLKRREDMAAIIGHAWLIPDELAADYPDTRDATIPETTYTDADGVVVLGLDNVVN